MDRRFLRYIDWFGYTLRWVGIIAIPLLLVMGCSKPECSENRDCSRIDQYCLQGKCVSSGQTESGGGSETVDEIAGGTESELALQEPTTQDGGPRCPISCISNDDCRFCGLRGTCDSSSRSCVDARELCPDVCGKDADCMRVGCGTRQSCSTSTGYCYEKIPECPARCDTDTDCPTAACGARTQCRSSSKTCVDPKTVICPSSCKANTDCTPQLCGNRTTCRNGQCVP